MTEPRKNSSAESLAHGSRSMPIRVVDGILTFIAVFYATTYLLLSRLALLVSTLLVTTMRSIGFDRIFPRGGAATAAAVVAEAGIVGLAWFPRDTWTGRSISLSIFVLLLGIAISGTRRALELPRGLREVKCSRSSFDRMVARHVANPHDTIFLRLTLVISVLMLPSFAAILVPASCSPYAMLLYVVLVTTCAEPFELVDHTNMHNHVFNPNRNCGPGSRKALRTLALFQQYALTLAMSRIPNRYRIQHIYVHHVENNGPLDPQSTLPYDRTSYFAFSRFALKMGINSTFPWDVSFYLLRARRYRMLVVLHASLLGYAAFVVILALVNLPAAILILALRFSFGVGAALLNFYEHGLIDPTDPENVYRNAATIAIVNEDDHGSLGNDFHIAHHSHPGRHWRQLIDDARVNVGLYRDADAIVFMDARAVVSDILRRRFHELAKRCDLRGRALSDVAQELQRRAGSPGKPRHDLIRRLDEGFGEFAGRLLITA